jgi:serine-type D-Ala-D-Ala carboxypeptidase/endopeptidase
MHEIFEGKHLTARMKLQRIARALAMACSITVACADAATPDVPTDNPHRSALDAAVDQAASRFFSNRCHVGASMAVIKADRIYFYDYGSTTRGKAVLPTPQSVYELASVTKTFTAYLAARAVLGGQMSLDGDFRRELPGDYSNLAWHGQPITLRMLLTHRSGMPRDIPDTDALFAHKDAPDFNARMIALNQGFGRNELLAALHDTQLRGAPGENQVYSNAGFLVIGLGLEKVAGQPFDTLVRQHITQPLGMASTGFALDASERSRLVDAYDRYGQPAPYHQPNAGASWGLYTSVEDLAKYVRWQLDGHDPAVRLSHQPLMGQANDGDAMAWNLGSDRGQPIIWHSGGSYGMSSQVVLYPDQREGYALLANDACVGTEGALKAIAMAIRASAAGH